MTKAPSHPRLTKAECEFWFEAGADWQEHTERRMEAHLADAFPDVTGVSEPFLWFQPNYLAVLSGPTGTRKRTRTSRRTPAASRAPWPLTRTPPSRAGSRRSF